MQGNLELVNVFRHTLQLHPTTLLLKRMQQAHTETQDQHCI